MQAYTIPKVRHYGKWSVVTTSVVIPPDPPPPPTITKLGGCEGGQVAGRGEGGYAAIAVLF